MGNMISKDSGVVQEWTIRRKMDCTLIDVIIVKGHLFVDHRKSNLMRAVHALLDEGHRITELRSEQDDCRKDLLVTMQMLRGQVVKSMQTHHAEKELYAFTYGIPVGEGPQRKRQRDTAEDVRKAVDDSVPRHEKVDIKSEEDMPKLKKFDTWTDSDEDFKLPAKPTLQERTVSPRKLSKKMKRVQRRRAFRKKMAEEQFARDCEDMSSLVANLHLIPAIEDENTGTPVQVVVQAVPAQDTHLVIIQPDESEISDLVHPVATDPVPSTSGVNQPNGDFPNFDVPFTSDDEREFNSAMAQWISRDDIVSPSSSLGFQPLLDSEEQNELPIGAEGGVDVNNNVVEDTTTELVRELEELDLESEVQNYYGISLDEERRLLLSDENDKDNESDISVEELNEALGRIMDDIDERLTRSLERNL